MDELYHYLCLTDLLDQDLSAYEFFQTLSAAEQSALRRYGSEITSFSELQSRVSRLRAEPETWAETLEGLQELFYHAKNRTGQSDDDLLAAMRRLFDGPARGSVERVEALLEEETEWDN